VKASELRNLDVATLRRIEARYGQFIPPERLAAAQECAVCYLDTPQMDAYLRQRRPDLTPTERAQILGLYDRERGAIVAASDRQMVLLPSTITPERLHSLSDPRYTEVMGLRLTEGTTEMLAQRIRRDMPLAGQPSIYPNETALLERLAARIGEARVSRAYFRGEMNQLAAELDRQLGKGAFNAVVHHARNGNWTAANRVLERGLR